MALIDCPNCGKQISDKASTCPYCSNKVQSFSDEEKATINNNVKIFIVGIIGILFICGLFSSTFSDSNTTKNSGAISTSSSTSTSTSKSFNVKYTDIKRFDYTITDNKLKLTRYNGSDTTVKIPNAYVINNNSYTVTELENSIFNGSDVNKLYIPNTITSITDNLLSYLNDDHIDIYYQGSEEEWYTIFTIYEATSVSDAYKSKDASGLGIALADWLNAKIGHEYDASKFTYHFNASVQDLVN